MMKKYATLFLIFFLVGCAYKGESLQSYLENPENLIKDPHFAKYRQARDDLEREYLEKRINYAEYVERRDELDETYDREVQEREAIISPQR